MTISAGASFCRATSTLDLTQDEAGRPLKPGDYSVGFEYSDCWVDDARLVVLNARDAADRGATSAPGPRLLRRTASDDVWRLTTVDCRPGGGTEAVQARILVNAAGPWVGRRPRCHPAA